MTLSIFKNCVFHYFFLYKAIETHCITGMTRFMFLIPLEWRLIGSQKTKKSLILFPKYFSAWFVFYSPEMHSTFKWCKSSLCKATLCETSCLCKCFAGNRLRSDYHMLFSFKRTNQGHTKDSQDIQEQIIIACSTIPDTHPRPTALHHYNHCIHKHCPL